MPVEATLTRTLDIRFIDARTIAIEAKLSLGISGYPSPHQEAMLVEEAIRIFEQSPAETKYGMRRLRDHLEACKHSDIYSRDGEENDESFSESSDDSNRRRSSVLSFFSRRSR